jgi:hypothetical protein
MVSYAPQFDEIYLFLQMFKNLKMNSWDDCSDVFAFHIGINKFQSKKNKSNPLI